MAFAVNSKIKDKNEVLFIDCVMFGKRAEVLGKYLSKGSPLLIDGRLNQNSWDDSGKTRYNYSVVIDTFTFLPKGGGKSNQQSDTPKEKPKDTSESSGSCAI
jgi:single-strand DNA-binding protein